MTGVWVQLGKAGGGENFVITPDGKTAYVTDPYYGTVTPVSTATNTPGTPIHLGGPRFGVGQIVITPDGKTAYVTTGPGTITPMSRPPTRPARRSRRR
jgi:hyaluronoglucosaminidase